MSNIKFLIIVDTAVGTITFKDNETNWSDIGGYPEKLTIYMRTENKDEYVVKREITDPSDISAFVGDGLTYTYAEFFSRVTPLDNFYKTEIVANEGEADQKLCDPMAVGFTYEIAELIYKATIGVHVPVEDLFESLTLGMMPQSLELLNVLSTVALYTYDRENKWRKIYNHLNIVVNDLNY